jgi:high-affinity iron transporter
MRRPPPHHRPFGAVVVLTSLVVVTASVVLAPAASSLVARSPSVDITVTSLRCAPGWRSRRAGTIVVHIVNRSGRGGSVSLLGPRTGATGARATLRPRTTVALVVALRAGRYRWRCRLHGLRASVSPAAAVLPAFSEDGPAGPMVAIPVTAAQMAGVVRSYRLYVEGQLALLTGEVQALRAVAAAGQLAGAQSAWLGAHLTWRHVGGASGAFGSLTTQIDGTAGGLQDGVVDPRFTGFHKVEVDLWQDHDPTAAAADANVLAGFVDTLVAQFPHDALAAAELPVRTHEILEDGLRDELSGDDDYGSGTDMASVEADVDGTRVLLALLAPLLAPRAPDLVARATAQLDRLDTALAATDSDGHWVAVADVPLAQREQVDAAIGDALEILAPVPDLLPVEGPNP